MQQHVETVFLNGTVEKDIYMDQPEDYGINRVNFIGVYMDSSSHLDTIINKLKRNN